MGKKSTPDYRGAAEETAASDQAMLAEQTRANRPDRINPWGTERWTQDADGNWTQTTTLDPSLQGALDSQIGLQQGRSDLAGGMLGRMQDEFGQPMDWSQFGEQQGLEFDPTEMRQRAEDAAYGRATSRLDPRFAQEGEALEVKLRNQGLAPGDAAYDSAMQNFNQAKTDAYSQAQNQAILQGRGESSQMWDQQRGTADYANQLRQNQIAEEMQKRGFSLNEVNALLTGQQVSAPQFQSFNQAGRGQATDYSGAAMNQGNFQQGSLQALYGGIGDLAGAAATGGMFSDRRLKRNIKRIGKWCGYPLYCFEYIWGKWAIGVMSDEIDPKYVTQHRTGYDLVNYQLLEADHD